MRFAMKLENPDECPMIDINIFIEDIYTKSRGFDKFERKIVKAVKDILEV